ncbi:MAG: phosphoribosylamine--glycine ligase [Treponema sp.]|nr:phosphoribosylamine--glycine ligase [Treponema sp.]
MKVLVVGNGGREHAIAWRLAQSKDVEQVVCVPGNGGTAYEDKCVNIDDEGGSYVEIAKRESCSMAVIGPENPLAEGLADDFWAAGISVVGPKRAAARLEASKGFAKDFMKKYGVASAASETFTDEKAALDYIKKHGAPIVVKADGLAAGKGVVVAKTLEEAQAAVREMMEDKKFGESGSSLVIEDYLTGNELSVLAAVSVTPEFAADGRACIIPFLGARDHKRLCDGAKGPNTGGMGAVAPVEGITPLISSQFEKNILQPTLKGLIDMKADYRGFIFFGLMLTEDGPKCLEYNVRLGDPETQAVLPLMDFDFAAMCKAIVDGTLKDFSFDWKPGCVVAPVAVSGGYPEEYRKGLPIECDKDLLVKSGAKLFIAGAKNDRRGDRIKTDDSMGLITSGGRVLACAAYGKDFQEAWNKAYEAMKAVHFEGMFYRKDIGLPGAAQSD